MPLQDSKVRRMGWLRVNVRTRGSSGSESGHSRGVGLERFFWVWMNFSRACEDKRVFLAMDFLSSHLAGRIWVQNAVGYRWFCLPRYYPKIFSDFHK